jgi:TRAP-type C4-dicarboxylate transport system permease small subunit
MKHLIQALTRAIGMAWTWAVALIVGGLLVVVASQVIDRHFIDLWRDSPEEYVKIGLIWLTFIGFALAMKSGTEIRVDLIDHFVPAKVRAVLYGAFDLVLLALIGIVIWKSWQVLVVSRDQVILGTDFSVAWPVAGMLGGLVLMFIVVVVRLVRRFMQPSSVDVRDPTKIY